jgi:hypothetical protein
MVFVPDMHTSSQSGVKGKGTIKIDQRADGAHLGSVSISVDISYSPPNQYPVLNDLQMDINLSDSLICSVKASTVEQISSVGKHTPTVYLTGRCGIKAGERTTLPTKACRYWLLIANNKPPEKRMTPDIISFLVYNCNGTVIAYGTGPLVDGDIKVEAT